MMSDIDSIAVFACRYAHTRQTGAALMVVKTLIAQKHLICKNTMDQIVREAKSDATCNIDDWAMLIKEFGDNE